MQTAYHTKCVWLTLLGFIISLMVIGCGIPTAAPPIATTTLFPPSTPTLSAYDQRVSQAKHKWQAQGITNYRVVLKFYENFHNQRHSQREIIVKQGQVVASSCADNKCPGFVLTDVYTVDDLFGLTQGTSLRPVFLKANETPEKCVRNLAFDVTYGFPNVLSFDCPDAYDEDHSVEVVSFEVLH